MKNQQKSSTTKINIALFTTILLGINLSIPAFVAAQTVSTGEGEEVIQPGILELTTVPANFNFPAVNITDFLAYNTMYENQQTTPEKLTAEDKRFSGGFEVQVTATDYVGQINPANVITVDKLGISTQVPNSTNSYTQTVELQNGYSNSEGTLMSGSNTYGNVLTQTLPFNFPMFNRESNQIYICTNGFIIQAGDTAGLASSDFATTCSDGDPFPAGDYAIIQPYFENGGTYKLTEETGFFFDSNNGIYYNEVSNNEVHIRFKANVRPNPPATSNLGNVEFTVYLFKDGRIEYHYGPNTDSTTPPVIGIYNTNPSTTISATEGDFDPGNLGSEQANFEIRFSPNNTLLNDVTKPGTPPDRKSVV